MEHGFATIRAKAWPLVVALAAMAQAARGDVPVDGFVLAGQSNMLGASTQNQDDKLGHVTSPTEAGLQSYSYRGADRRWVLANEFPCDDSQCSGTNCAYPGPTRTAAIHPQWVDDGYGTCVCNCGVHLPSINANADAGFGSAWPTFAERWMSERQHEVRFVATAIGGQALVASDGGIQPTWDPDAMDCNSLTPVPPGSAQPPLAAPGELYCRMLETVAQSGVSNLRAVLWQQGESDVGKVTGAQYRAALENLADHIWQALGVPLVVAPVSTKTRSDDACTAVASEIEIHDATIAAANEHPHILLGAPVDDLALEPDCTHIHDVVELGNRWYDSVAMISAACNDGLDEDGDGLFDYPQDPGCASPIDTSEIGECQDGVDNDGNGKVDFPADAGCTSAADASEGGECGDGVDNDGDGAIDWPADLGCNTPEDRSERFDCSDGIDDDGDGAIDYPNDPGCASAEGATERPACNDGIDNDRDGRVDFDGGAAVNGGVAVAPPDLGCTRSSSGSESSKRSCGLGAELVALVYFVRRRRSSLHRRT